MRVMVKPELAQIPVAPEESQFETTDVTFITKGPPEIWIVGGNCHLACE